MLICQVMLLSSRRRRSDCVKEPTSDAISILVYQTISLNLRFLIWVKFTSVDYGLW